MIDRILLDEQPVEVRHKVRRALAMLADTGILKTQSEELFKRVAQSQEEDDAAVLKQLRACREESNLLLGLHNLGLDFLKEIEE